MPDPLRQTISATESAALFEVSPYLTRWMLYERFVHGVEEYRAPHSRMDWGTKLEPLILAQAAEDLKFEVKPNIGPDGKQVYLRNGKIGCTRDADIYSPDRGPGVCEVKCVFDYRTWMAEWKGGNKVPRQNEIQVQVQMKVGAGESNLGAGDGKPFEWGVFAVWVAGDVYYFERKPIPKLWQALDKEVAAFFRDVQAKKEPEPFGVPVEYPLLNEVYPIEEEKVLDLRTHADGESLADDARMLNYHREQRLGHKRGEDNLAMRFYVYAKTHGKLLLPHGIIVNLKQNKGGVGMKVYVPSDITEGEIEYA
jgi:hypothetical protein